MILRELNETGRENFRSFVRALRAGEEPLMLVSSILEDEDQTDTTSLNAELSLEKFATRYDMGVHLVDLLSNSELSDLSGRDGLWDWIAMAWFDQLAGSKVDDEVNYILSEKHTRRYRHAVYFTWWLVNKYGADARFLLSNPPHKRGEVAEQILSVQYLPNCPSFIKTASALYWDADRQSLKRGSGGKGPGSPRRFMAWIAQIEVNYDLFEMSHHALAGMLPAEFEKFLD